MSLFYKRDRIAQAKRLRKEATPEENHLWYDFLSSYPVRFQRQKTIGRYIADFYCHKARLVIEIDGSQHYEEDGKKYDLRRTSELESMGLKLVRYSNREINQSFSSVCEHIHLTVQSRIEQGPLREGAGKNL